MLDRGRLRLTMILIVLLVTPALHAGEVKAIWIWEQDSFRMLDEPDWRNEVLTALERDGFNTLYLYADSFEGRTPITDESALYAQLLREAHGRGFKVEALLGSAHLATNRYVLPDNRGEARAMLGRVIAYNTSRQVEEQFDAIHLDIEPYTLPEWKEDRATIAELYIDAVREWRRAAHDASIEIGAAIPFWFDRVTRGESTLVVAIIEAFDYVALMDYRDQAAGHDGIIEHGRYEIDLAGRLGRKVVIGVETDAADLDKLTFFEEGRKVMNKQLKEVSDAFASEPGYGGLAVHYLATYLTMKE